MYASHITDLFNEEVKMAMEIDLKKKEQLMLKFKNEIWPKNFKIFDERIETNKSGYLVGERLTWVDLHLVRYFEVFEYEKIQVLDKFSNLRDFLQMVKKLPKIANWLDSRPETTF